MEKIPVLMETTMVPTQGDVVNVGIIGTGMNTKQKKMDGGFSNLHGQKELENHSVLGVTKSMLRGKNELV